jgi:hypothetical protein
VQVAAPLGERDHGVPHELARSMPGGLATALDFDDFHAEVTPLGSRCPSAQGHHRRVLDSSWSARASR